MRSTRITLLVALALPALLVAVAAPTLGQAQSADQPRGEFGEELEVGEVLLDVQVTDREGNVIVGLGPEDFVVEENGEPREVTSVSFYGNSRIAAPAAAKAEGAMQVEVLPEDRYFILFFEDQRHRQFDTDVPLLSQQLEAGRYAKRWVAEELLPQDWVAVVTYDARMKVQTDFTRDRAALTAAIDDAVQGKSLKLDAWSKAANTRGPSLIDDLPVGRHLRKATPRIYDAVELVAEATGDIRARKNLVMFTTGFGLLTTTDRQDARYYEPMMQALNDNNVAAYMVDLTPNNVNHAMSDQMNQLAEHTGGEYFFNFTNFLTPLSQIDEENDSYYLLSYRSSHPRGERGYQEVEVRTVNPDLRVKSRDGYVYGDEDPLAIDTSPGVSAAR